MKKLLVLLGGVASIVAFAFMFMNGIKITTVAGQLSTVSYVEGLKALLGNPDALVLKSGAIGSFIGFIMMPVFGLIALAVELFVKDKKAKKYLPLLCGLAVIAGAVLVFLEKSFFMTANNLKNALGVTYGMAVGPILGGIIGACGGLALVASAAFKK